MTSFSQGLTENLFPLLRLLGTNTGRTYDFSGTELPLTGR